MIRRDRHKFIAKDDGFSLVELIVCVSILAIASVALMKSFSMAAIVNSKAQRKQSATSLAESVMEEVKSSGIKQLQKNYNGGAETVISIANADSDYDSLADLGLAKVPDPDSDDPKCALVTGSDASNPYYILVKKGITSTKGEKFNVTATMRTKPYSVAKNDSASDANSIKLPVIEEIDTHTKTVLSQKELNKYDIAAVDYFHDHTISPGAAPLKSKEIIVKKSGDGSATADPIHPEKGRIEVVCMVRYTASDGSLYSKEVFRGTYVAQKDKDGNLQKVDNDIYIFYNRFLSDAPSNEKITIEDTSTDDAHRAFVLFQNDLMNDTDSTNDVAMDDLDGTTIAVSNGGATPKISVTSNGALNYDDDGETVYGKANADGYWLITNLGQSSGTPGSMLIKKKKSRIFEVTVRVNKADNTETYATITSTVNVSE